MKTTAVTAARRGLLPAGVAAAASVLVAGPGLLNSLAVPLLSTGLFFLGLRAHRPPHEREWRLVGIGLWFHLVAGITYAVAAPRWISLGLVWTGYVFAALGVSLTVRALEHRGDRTGVIDAAIVAVGSIVLVGQLMLVGGSGMPGAAELYTVVDATLLGLVTRLQLRRGAPSQTLSALCLALSTMLVMDLAQVLGGAGATDISTALSNLSYALVAVAVLHPSVRTLTAPVTNGECLQPLRVLILGLFLVASNAVLGLLAFLDHGAGNVAVTVGIVLGPTVLSVMVALRLASALRDQARIREELAYRALHDPLTGLVNRAEITDVIDRTLQNAVDVGRVGVLFCDLDDFKVVNDTYGHKMGDELLQLIAARLRDTVRPGDTVGRLGGDEFVVCCADIDAHELDAVARRVTAALAVPARIGGHMLVPAVSIGAATAAPGMNVDDLLHLADGAMYGDKRREVVGPRPTLRQRSDGIADAFRRGLTTEEIVAHYQPIVSISDGALVGAEALARWEDPRFGLRRPAEFLPHLVDAGTFDELGLRMLDLALSAVPAGQVVSVNVAPSQLRPVFTDRVARLLDAHRVRPAQLMLEITESGFLDASFSVRSTLRGLRDVGVRLALDDFGTGASSLSHLQWIDVDCLKIDRSFVQSIVCSDGEGSARSRAVVEGTLLMAHRLGLTVIAEGVETRAQLDALADLGCDAAQGYHLGHPDEQWPGHGVPVPFEEIRRIAAG